MSREKEPHFLLRDELSTRLFHGVWDAQEYAAQWSGTKPVRGEVSVYYLYFPDEFIASLRATVPDPKVVVLLRNPVDRAYSAYLDTRLKTNLEPAATFAEMVDREMERGPRRLDGSISPAKRHLSLGFYSPGLRRLVEELGEDRVHMMLTEDLRPPAQDGALQRLHDFLGVDQWVPQEQVVDQNKGQLRWDNPLLGAAARGRAAGVARRWLKARVPSVHRRLVATAKKRAVSAPRIEPEMRRRLTDFYAGEVTELEGLVGRSLHHWRSTS